MSPAHSFLHMHLHVSSYNNNKTNKKGLGLWAYNLLGGDTFLNIEPLEDLLFVEWVKEGEGDDVK